MWSAVSLRRQSKIRLRVKEEPSTSWSPWTSTGGTLLKGSTRARLALRTTSDGHLSWRPPTRPTRLSSDRPLRNWTTEMNSEFAMSAWLSLLSPKKSTFQWWAPFTRTRLTLPLVKLALVRLRQLKISPLRLDTLWLFVIHPIKLMSHNWSSSSKA